MIETRMRKKVEFERNVVPYIDSISRSVTTPT